MLTFKSQGYESLYLKNRIKVHFIFYTSNELGLYAVCNLMAVCQITHLSNSSVI